MLMLFLALHAFGLAKINTDFFTKFLISLLFVLLLLPMVPHVKIFDLVEVRRDTRILSTAKKGKK